MKLDDGVNFKLKELRALKNYGLLKKELRKIHMSSYYKKLDNNEKINVVYTLCFLYSKEEKNREICIEYLLELGELFCSINKDDYKIEFYRYVWLNVNINNEKMSRMKVVNDMMSIYRFHISLDDYRNAYGAIANIAEINKDAEGVLECLIILLKQTKNLKKDILDSFLEALNKLDEKLYIKGKNIISEYIAEQSANIS